MSTDRRKHRKGRHAAVLLSCLMSLTIMLGVGHQVSAQSAGSPEAPYQSFTYDKHNQAIPSPHGYLPESLISGTEMGVDGLSNPQDMFIDDAGIIIADTGNNRILLLDENFELVSEITGYETDGNETGFNFPSGVFRDAEQQIYIADQQNGKVVVLNADGSTRDVFGTPVSPLIDPAMRYQPSKVVADSFGRIFVQAKGVYEGLISLDQEGEFLNFFGSNPVKMTPQMIINKIWRTILSDEQRASMQAFIPVEYSNITIDEDNFIYATVSSSSAISQSMVKINPLGAIINEWTFPNSLMADAGFSSRDMVTALDAQNGYLYVVPDQEDRGLQTVLFNYGGRGDKLGTFRQPTAIAYQGEDLLVLDATKNSITRFRLTDFGRKVHEAMALYADGAYQQSLEPWGEVIARDQNYLIAHRGQGKAYFQTEEYEKAMVSFRLADDRQSYSEAFQRYSVEVMRENFGWIVLGIIGLIVGVKVVGKARKRHTANRTNEVTA